MYSEELRESLVSLGAVPNTAPPHKVMQYLERCRILGLEPTRNDLCLVMKNTHEGGKEYHLIVSIGTLRSYAASIESYQITELDYNRDELKAYCTVKRGDRVCKAVCLYEEYAPFTPNKFWTEKTGTMLLKTVEAHAIRSAYPELAGLYLHEEMREPKQNDTDLNDVLLKLLKK